MESLGVAARLAQESQDWDRPFHIPEETFEELKGYESTVEANPWNTARSNKTPEVDVWSDASLSRSAYIVASGLEVLGADSWDSERHHIFLLELTAAMRGLLNAYDMGHKSIRLYVDNAPAAAALARRVSTNRMANIILSHLPPDVELEVKWVPTSEQCADYLTRPVLGKYIDLPEPGSVLVRPAPKKEGGECQSRLRGDNAAFKQPRENKAKINQV